jgi:hypothetical protein
MIADKPDSKRSFMDELARTMRQVFAWDGIQMVQVEPSTMDQEILAALSARDDAGSWNDWAL